MAGKKAAPKTRAVQMNERQMSVMRNLTLAVQELQGRQQSYLQGIADSNNIPEGFGVTGISNEGIITFREQEQQAPELVGSE
jgi:hypothetical protein